MRGKIFTSLSNKKKNTGFKIKFIINVKCKKSVKSAAEIRNVQEGFKIKLDHLIYCKNIFNKQVCIKAV